MCRNGLAVGFCRRHANSHLQKKHFDFPPLRGIATKEAVEQNDAEVPVKGSYLGEFEELVLLAVRSLGNGAYGVTVQQRIEAVASRSATLGSVYSALDRLERKDCVHSWVGGNTAEVGGRRKRYFELTPGGQRLLEHARQARDAMWDLAESGDA